MLRNTSAADDELCWGNVSLLPESQARACGFTTEATLCKKHYDEKNQKNKLKCCFPLRDDQDCHRNLVSCPRRLFPVFDCLGKNLNTGTFICEAHLKLADEDKRICDNGAYTPPKKVRHSHLLILHSPGILLCATKPFVDVCILVPRAYDPSGPRQESRALGATISGMRHRCRCAVSRITRIRLFPLFFYNGCSQSSRFLPQARRIVGSGVENGTFETTPSPPTDTPPVTDLFV